MRCRLPGVSKQKFKKQKVNFFFKELGKLLPGHPALVGQGPGTRAHKGMARPPRGSMWGVGLQAPDGTAPEMGTAEDPIR